MTFRGHIKKGVVVLEDQIGLPDGTPVRVEVDLPAGDFWHGKSISALMVEQRIYPGSNPFELGSLWPDDESLDEFLAFIREARC